MNSLINSGAIWLIIACLVLILELATGSVFLLIISAALFGGAITVFLGLGNNIAYFVSSIMAVLGFLAMRQWQKKIPLNPDINLEIEQGYPVSIISFNPHGFSRIEYRGTEWDALLENATSLDTIPKQAYLIGRDGNIMLISLEIPGKTIEREKQLFAEDEKS